MNKFICIITVGALSVTAAVATAASAPALQKEAKIQLPQARTIALKTYPGKIVSEELEREDGGSGLRYSFDIAHGKVVHEVGVDAKTGKVLENSVDNDHD